MDEGYNGGMKVGDAWLWERAGPYWSTIQAQAGVEEYPYDTRALKKQHINSGSIIHRRY